MISSLTIWVNILFLLCLLWVVLFFLKINKSHFSVIILLLVWIIFHSFLSLKGFYRFTEEPNFRFGLILLPSVLFVFLYGVIRPVSNRRNLTESTLLHIVRLPMEIILLHLYHQRFIPQLMTFEGRNFDIVVGVSTFIMALLIYKKVVSDRIVLLWNVFGLCFILFIMSNAILSAPLPFQQFAFEQPNIAVSYFPFVLLPAVIVPLVIVTHIQDIRFLVSKNKNLS